MAQSRRQAARSEPTSSSAPTPPFRVRIGMLGGEPRTVNGTAGMTVSQALQQAGVAGQIKVLLRGVPVEANAVLDSDVMLIVSTNVRGG